MIVKNGVTHNTVNVKVSTTRDCKWYYFFVDEGTSKEEIEKKIDESKATRWQIKIQHLKL